MVNSQQSMEHNSVANVLGNSVFAITGVYDGAYGLTVIKNIVGAKSVNVWGSVYTVVSNSSVSNLVFNSTSKVLSFIVSGPSGTVGCANVTIAKTLIESISDVTVYLDGNQISYTVASNGYYWSLSFIYHHSTHHVVMNLAALRTAPSPGVQYWMLDLLSGIVIVMIAIALATTAVIMKKKVKKT